ncbi:dehydrogenase [Thermopolyspora flexuosa]|uniref:Phosphoglycerate dehydrogenase-like enzyme n=1 Tax=Thermopolyspora flexuosa TaxID=103836 RepID=A0A543ITS8_9ACTN|nr:2-hydroxyacid dehydrogenase [Thermopolyspora flexuosa]TQM73985.1 phosphoglycerate dehydrogenase-like enzyme [Thermopolyspora flexuosa]GGM93659.1 dehydrogenase [Thermopolyspora flexuosa]
MRIWVPSQAAADVLADLPEVECVVFDGTTPPPEGAEKVEVFIPPLSPSYDVPALFAKMTSLRLVQTVSAGVEPYLPHLPEGVTLCNARGVHDAGTAEWAVGAMLAMLRDFPRFADRQRKGIWDYHYTDALADSTVLIIGYGSIGQALERRLAPFEVNVIRVARTARQGPDGRVVHGQDELPGLLPLADVVVLLVPQTPDTRRMVDAGFLARMKDGAVLVNAARGSVVDTDALLDELSAGRLRAALDVTDPEPLPPDHPLWRAPGIMITPHVAGCTPASQRRVLSLIRSQMLRYLSGEPLRNVITGSY